MGRTRFLAAENIAARWASVPGALLRATHAPPKASDREAIEAQDRNIPVATVLRRRYGPRTGRDTRGVQRSDVLQPACRRVRNAGCGALEGRSPFQARARIRAGAAARKLNGWFSQTNPSSKPAPDYADPSLRSSAAMLPLATSARTPYIVSRDGYNEENHSYRPDILDLPGGQCRSRAAISRRSGHQRGVNEVSA